MSATDEVLTKVILSNKYAKPREIEEARAWGQRYHPERDLPDLLFMKGLIDRPRVSLIRKLAKMSGAGARVGAETLREDGAEEASAPSPAAGKGARVRVRELRPDPPERVGHYVLLEKVARGGMGVIYKARHPDLDRLFAVKLLTPRAEASDEALARFQREAKAAARLDHPNIVRVYDAGTDNGFPYLVMDFVDGPNLQKLIKEEGVGQRKAAQLTRQMALALQHAHDHGLVHRDIKPENVILERSSGEPKITDFGIVKELAGDAEDAKLTQTGFTLGSPCYMSPEQAEGRHDQVGAATDVYSLSATLYEMLTGDPPFDGESIHEIMTRVVRDEPVPVRQKNHTVPIELELICMKALEKEPERRYASAREFAEDLGRYLADEPLLVKPAGTWTKGVRALRRNRFTAALVAVFLLTAGTGLGLAWSWQRTLRQERRAEREARIVRAEKWVAQAAATDAPFDKRRAYYEALHELELVLRDRPDDERAIRDKREVVLALGDHLIESGEPSFAEFVFSLGAGVADAAAIGSRIEAARLGLWAEKAEEAELAGDPERALDLYTKGLRALREAGYQGERLSARIVALEGVIAQRKTALEVDELRRLGESAGAKGDHPAAYLAYLRAAAMAPDDLDLAGRIAFHREKAVEHTLNLFGEALASRARVGTVRQIEGNDEASAGLAELLAVGDEALERAERTLEASDFQGALHSVGRANDAFARAYAMAGAVRARTISRQAALEAEGKDAATFATAHLGAAKDLQFRGDAAFQRGAYDEARSNYVRAATSYRQAARQGDSRSKVAEARESAQTVRQQVLNALDKRQRTASFRAADDEFARAEAKYDLQEHTLARDLYLKAKQGFEGVLAAAPQLRLAFATQDQVELLREECEREQAREYASDEFSRARQAHLEGDRALADDDPAKAIETYNQAVYFYGRAVKAAKPHADAKREFDALLARVHDARQYCLDQQVEWKPAFKRAEEHLNEAHDAVRQRYWNGSRRHLGHALRLYQSLQE